MKYLFNQTVQIGDKKVQINKVENFEGINNEDINIVFTTIQALHSDLTTEKENSLTFEDFKDKKIVLIADEAHHINVKTKRKQKEELFEQPNWENTVENVLSKNKENILLEFTATLDFLEKNIEEKYKKKIIFKYDLAQFRKDGYSKEVDILQVDSEEKDRILLALILNQYRQEVATKYGINLKPVILFKAQKTIAESKENKAKFHHLIETLKEERIEKIKKLDVPITKKIFHFFKEQGISHKLIMEKLKINFSENKCISVNEEKEKEENQLLINSLENKNNQIRAIFAVQKLNEGWDVLNLFDIVRLYKTRQSGWGKVSPTTIAEAQLIGRGARYYPFIIENGQNKFKRKYDNDLENDLRILEELHYHSVYDSRYIAELRDALKSEGMLDDNTVEKQLRLKDVFTKTLFYKSGYIYLNKQIQNDFKMIHSFKDIGVKKHNYRYEVPTSKGQNIIAFAENGEDKNGRKTEQRDLRLADILSIVRKALAKNTFFSFSNINHYFPNIDSTIDFIKSKDYLGGLGITFIGTSRQLDNIPANYILDAILGLLSEIEKELKKNTSEKVGSEDFIPSSLEKVFYNKTLKIDKKSERANGQENFVMDKPWYVYNANFGTSEEKAFISMFDRLTQKLKEKYSHIFLIRNERQFKIFNFRDGQPFEPDFVLYMKEKANGKSSTYQVFIEPKGKHLQPVDKWKEDFLLQIKEKFKNNILKLTGSQKYRIIGVPFYNVDDENEFNKEFQNILNQ